MPAKKSKSEVLFHAGWTGDADFRLPKRKQAILQHLVGPKACTQIERAFQLYACAAAEREGEPGDRKSIRALSTLAQWTATGQDLLAKIDPAIMERMGDIAPNISGEDLRRSLANLLGRFDDLVFLTLDAIKPRRGRSVKTLERNLAGRIAGIMEEHGLPTFTTKGIEHISDDSLLLQVLNLLLPHNQAKLARYAVKNPRVP